MSLTKIRDRRSGIEVGFHYGLILLTLLPAAMNTAVRPTYLVTVANIEPWLVGTFTYSTGILSILALHFASFGLLDRWNPIRVCLVSLGAAIFSVFCVYWSFTSALFLIPAAVLSSIAQFVSSSIFVFDEIYGPRRSGEQGLYSTRQLMSATWILGPPLSFMIFSMGGFGWVAAVTCTCMAFASFSLIAIGRRGLAQKNAISEAKNKSKTEGTIPVGAIFLVMVATTCANFLQALSLPIYAIEDLRLETYWPGWFMATASATEVLVIFCLPAVEKRISREGILVFGLSLGGIYFISIWFLSDPISILLMQIVYGLHFACSAAICLPLLRRALVSGTGSLAAQFNNAGRIGGLVASAIFAVVGTLLGYKMTLSVICPIVLFGAICWLLLKGNGIRFWNSTN